MLDKTEGVVVLKIHEVAERLRISQACAYALVEAKELAHYRIGVGRGTIRVSEQQLSEYLERKKVEQGKATAQAPPVQLRHLAVKLD